MHPFRTPLCFPSYSPPPVSPLFPPLIPLRPLLSPPASPPFPLCFPSFPPLHPLLMLPSLAYPPSLPLPTVPTFHLQFGALWTDGNGQICYAEMNVVLLELTSNDWSAWQPQKLVVSWKGDLIWRDRL
ncbi:unnamed protein product [Closterium sp. Naga37s-1]|nr:unnamed protein product [Closterium sp. Naga37s-1]